MSSGLSACLSRPRPAAGELDRLRVRDQDLLHGSAAVAAIGFITFNRLDDHKSGRPSLVADFDEASAQGRRTSTRYRPSASGSRWRIGAGSGEAAGGRCRRGLRRRLAPTGAADRCARRGSCVAVFELDLRSARVAKHLAAAGMAWCRPSCVRAFSAFFSGRGFRSAFLLATGTPARGLCVWRPACRRWLRR